MYLMTLSHFGVVSVSTPKEYFVFQYVFDDSIALWSGQGIKTEGILDIQDVFGDSITLWSSHSINT